MVVCVLGLVVEAHLDMRWHLEGERVETGL